MSTTCTDMVVYDPKISSQHELLENLVRLHNLLKLWATPEFMPIIFLGEIESFPAFAGEKAYFGEQRHFITLATGEEEELYAISPYDGIYCFLPAF